MQSPILFDPPTPNGSRFLPSNPFHIKKYSLFFGPLQYLHNLINMGWMKTAPILPTDVVAGI